MSRNRYIAALAIDATSGTVVVCNADGGADGPALMYDDARALTQTARVNQAGQGLWARTGNRPQRSWGLVKAVWLVENGRLQPGQRLMDQAQYIGSRLAGTGVATDTSHSLKLGIDLRTASWPADVFAALGLSTAFPSPVVIPGTVIGEVSRPAARVCGLAAGTEIRAGMTDGCAAQIAAGAFQPGSWTSALGSTLTVKGTSAQPLMDADGALYNHRNPDGGWLPGGASNVGAAALSHVLSALPPTADELAALTIGAAAFEPAPGVTYPGAEVGERFPFVAPQARGFTTISSNLPAARFAGVLQGVAYVERYCYQRIVELGGAITEPLVFTGATTTNDYWNQLRCDVLGREVVIPRAADAARGMAVLAAAAPGQLGATAVRMRRTARRYEPDGRRNQRHLDNYHELLHLLGERGWLTAHELSTSPRHVDA